MWDHEQDLPYDGDCAESADFQYAHEERIAGQPVPHPTMPIMPIMPIMPLTPIMLRNLL
ncbi:MAG: hypothetical protein F2694_01955 [Actinobacteria bacterium]|uniref:Unannotated protein n=1 Tax=freshwater metagenome TaxID=449393 RepID=A0A6J6SBY6_9ZZZZ|nr:hypothetical protein [Actinomycetota bacterium]